jgi:CBS-domain-containing membrane protein
MSRRHRHLTGGARDTALLVLVVVMLGASVGLLFALADAPLLGVLLGGCLVVALILTEDS